MRANLLLCALLLASLTGCMSQQQLRPCGPGFLGNILIPQGFVGVDFRPACRRHDNCYMTDSPRKACDQRFLNDMLGACNCSPLPCLCRLRAYQWYWQVRLFGGPGYQESQRMRHDCGGCGCGSGGACGACGGDACGSCGGCASPGCASCCDSSSGCSSCGCGTPGGCCAGGTATADELPLEHYSYDAEAMLNGPRRR